MANEKIAIASPDASLSAPVKPTATASPYRRLTLANALALWRYLLLRARFPNLDASIFYIGSGYDLRIEPGAHIHFGRGVQFMRDFTAHFAGSVSLGDGVFFNRGCSVYALESLTIGDHSLFGERVSIHDENHNTHGSGPMYARGVVTAPVVIGSNVWVGAKATILQGVTIGDGAVVGANAVVTRSIPAHMLAVGVPARVVRELI